MLHSRANFLKSDVMSFMLCCLLYWSSKAIGSDPLLDRSPKEKAAGSQRDGQCRSAAVHALERGLLISTCSVEAVTKSSGSRNQAVDIDAELVVGAERLRAMTRTKALCSFLAQKSECHIPTEQKSRGALQPQGTKRAHQDRRQASGSADGLHHHTCS